jgi:hypothetical protein
MSGFRGNFADLNQIGVDFLLTDLDLAMTFMDIAAASHIPETILRNHNNARKAYDAVEHLLGKLTPDAGQRQEIDTKLALLKTRLQAVGRANSKRPS